ncbi:hypothetical protein F5X97DRAFT_126254 [Nemania serpens]|nr:hypothetical protein F5X97DRAFT_126254 [Nemania serpens]
MYFPLYGEPVRALVFSLDGSQLASLSGSSRTVQLWDTKTGVLRRMTKCHPDLVAAAASYFFRDECLPLDLDGTGRWVMRDNRKALLLPPDREGHACAVRGNKLFIGRMSGGLTVLEIDPTQT